MIGIVVSRADPASMAIGKALRTHTDWDEVKDASTDPAHGGGTVRHRPGYELRTFAQLHLELENVAEVFSDPDAIVFVSKHAGDTGPLLSTHFPGNIGKARYGGAPQELPAAAPALADSLYQRLRKHAPPGYEVGIECTHHGPSAVGAPALFVEIGSDETAWKDPDAAASVAAAVLSLDGTDPFAGDTIVGLGGGHYAPRFERILRETSWRVGHIAATWALDELETDADLAKMIEMTIERSRADAVVIDGGHPSLAAAVESVNGRVVSETWVRETEGVAMETVDRVEAQLGAIDRGVRLGEQARENPDAIRRIKLPEDLVAILNGRLGEQALSAIASVSVALATVEGRTRLAGEILVPVDTDMDDVIETLRPALSTEFQSVHIDDGRLRLIDREFDPEAARAKNVPAGPAYGRLANGESVTVDGRRIDPGQVVREVERAIPLDVE